MAKGKEKYMDLYSDKNTVSICARKCSAIGEKSGISSKRDKALSPTGDA